MSCHPEGKKAWGRTVGLPLKEKLRREERVSLLLAQTGGNSQGRTKDFLPWASPLEENQRGQIFVFYAKTFARKLSFYFNYYSRFCCYAVHVVTCWVCEAQMKFTRAGNPSGAKATFWPIPTGARVPTGLGGRVKPESYLAIRMCCYFFCLHYFIQV